MISTLLSLITAVAAIVIIVMIWSIIIRKQIKVGNLISKAKTFDDIDKLRHELPPMKWSEDIDEQEKGLITRHIARINEYSPEEIVRAYIRAHRKGFEEIREKLRKIIVINLKIRLDYARQTKNAGPDLRKKLKQLQRMAGVIDHKIYINEIENMLEIREPAQT